MYVSSTSNESGPLLGDAEAYMVDITRYGRNAMWSAMQTNRYEEPERQVNVVQFDTMQGFCSIRSDAAVKITG